MIKFNLRFYIVLIANILVCSTVFGQFATKDLLTHKVMITHPDHTEVTFIEPVKKQKIYDDKYYYWYSSNQINMTQGGYSGSLLNGDYKDFHQNKNLKVSGKFKAGLKNDIWNLWNEQGILLDSYSWRKGKKSGNYSKYDSTGRTIETGKYCNNLLQGKQTIVEGDSIRVIYYKKGKVKEHKSFLPKFIRDIF
ncbi:toxin-antitoxin system YwqK family antitoxin [Pedobacter metabolipauper]|uniref:MORN repeat protein n=1 Tax=Pedobacter metabolipauper TaxID=425513 RepID=A0A4R6SYP7_9SPHI|nr:hypothetical protein [Pedobacter metabolipauper]TDQ11566.1 hypothetical protein ATK78_0689 [Pedobacter metabolipauper]